MKRTLLASLLIANLSAPASAMTVNCLDQATGHKLVMNLADSEPLRGTARLTRRGKAIATLRCYDKPVWGCGTQDTYKVTFMAFIRTLPLMHKGTKVADLICN